MDMPTSFIVNAKMLSLQNIINHIATINPPSALQWWVSLLLPILWFLLGVHTNDTGILQM
jgi:hypothetical protein